ncbi:WRNexo [Acrasis kona]|uniref:WRNexo n=1 Tax=Acrasis kona TaxID=1008807 RepID=A0AAW2YR79_9EUKA
MSRQSSSTRYGDRDERIARTVYVGGIDKNVSASDIVDFFSICGPIAFIRLDIDTQGTRPSKSGFIEFLASTSAQNALKLTGKQLFNTIIKVAKSENTLQKPIIELTNDEKDNVDHALRHIHRRMRRWEKSQNSDYDNDKKRRGSHSDASDGDDKSRKKEKRKHKKRRRHQHVELSVDEEFKKKHSISDSQEKFELPADYKIVPTNDEERVNAWISEYITSEVTCVGMDSEWDVTDGEDSKYPDVIAVATEKSCLLYQTQFKHLSVKFANLLINPRIKKVWCNVDRDLRKLRKLTERRLNDYDEEGKLIDECVSELRDPKCHIDIDDFMDSEDISGVKRVCSFMLNKMVERSSEIASSRWYTTSLTSGQERYLAEGAYIPMTAYNILKSRQHNH